MPHDEGISLITAKFIEEGFLNPQIRAPLYYWTIFVVWKLLFIYDPWLRWFVAKLITCFSVGLIGVFIYFTARRVYKREYPAIFSSLMFLASVQRYYLGSSADSRYFSLMFVVIAMFLIIDDEKKLEKFPLAFSLLGLALISRPEVLPFIVVFMAIDLMNSCKKMKKLLVNIIVLALPIVLFSPHIYFIVKQLLFDYFGIGGVLYGVSSPYTPMSLPEKVTWLKLGLEGMYPLFMVGFLALPLFIMSKVSLKAKLLILTSPIVFLLTTLFLLPLFASYWCLYTEPFFAVMSGSIIMSLFENKKHLLIFKMSKKCLKVAFCLSIMIYLIFSSLIISWLHLDLVRCSPKAYLAWSNRPRNLYLKEVVDIVSNYSEPQDYVITIPIVAFLANRKLPHNLCYNEKVLTEVAKNYNVKVINIFPIEGSITAAIECDKFIRNYVHQYYQPVYLSPRSDPHYGIIWVRNDVYLDKHKQIILDYEFYWERQGWGIDISTPGATIRPSGFTPASVFCPVVKAGDNYIKRGLWLPNGTYQIYTRAYARGNIFSIQVDSFRFIITEPSDGGWTLIKVGTLCLNEGNHTFCLSFLSGSMNDIQDYLLIIKID